MRTLFAYTWQMVRKNKRTSWSILISVLLASTLLCAMCTYAWTQLRWRVDIEEYENGSWHGEIGGEIPAERLSVAEQNLYVAATMIKGPYTCLKLSEESRLPYLLLRDADENYWTYMGERNAILEGHVPNRPGEIVVSKSFFEQNPQYRLGDTITLPAGERRLGEDALDVIAIRQEGETFFPTGESAVTLVGIMDVTTNTTIPGYYAMGFLDRASLTGGEDLVIYVKLNDIRKTYEVMPQLADAMGVGKDEYGRYENHFSYHTMLLSLNFVFPPDMELRLENIGGILSYCVILLLLMGTFATIICSAFWVSASARMKQLGMFRSIGATPGQVAASILIEGLILSVCPILFSIGIGYGFTAVLIKLYSNIAGDSLYFPITVRFSPLIALFAALLSLITVLLAAFWPAVKVARLSPLEAIRMQESVSVRHRRPKRRRLTKTKERKHVGVQQPVWGTDSVGESGPVRQDGRHWRRRIRPRAGIARLSGYEAELAEASYRANRRAFRAGMLSLTLCLMLLIGFFALMSLNDYLSERNRSADEYNIYARLDMMTEADRELLAGLQGIPGEEKSVCYCVTRLAYWASPEQETEEFRERGGFAGLDLNRWALVERDGTYRVRVWLYGVQEEFFDAYCRRLGLDPAEFYRTDRVRAVAQSMAPLYPEVVNNAEKSDLSYPHLTFSAGEELLCLEKTEDSVEGDARIPIEVGAVAEYAPELGDIRNSYTVNLYLPLEVYYSVIAQLSGEQAGGYNTIVKVKTAPEDDLAVTDRITALCDSVMAGEDIYITSTAKEQEENAAGMRAMGLVMNCIGLLLGLIGVSNTLSAVSHIMLRRRREFAMLRSVGMDADGVRRLLLLEGIRMAVTPVAAAITVSVAILAALMHIVDVSWGAFLPWLPWGKILGCITAVILAVAASYQLCAGRIKKDTIIEAVREETV
ncbi:MAG: ABC transporter permease [Roseburia sp.]|jgi:putative ABC transport system permease protein|nr:ABC transporter permease [Roseburia sp.]